MRKVEGTISSGTTGLPVLHAQVSVLNADSTPAQLYSDNGVTPLDQPVLTNGLGYWSFYVADGTYTRVVANPDGSNPIAFPDEEMYEDARNVSVPVGEAAVSLPSVGARMGRVLGFDSAGAPIAFDPFIDTDPTTAVAQEALLRAIADSDERTRAIAAESSLTASIGVVEADVAALQDDVTGLDAAIAAAALGGVIGVKYDTQAHLYADLAWAAGTIGWVYADSTAAKNDLYLKSGSSGSGSWSAPLGVFATAALAYVQPSVDTAVAAAATATAAAATIVPALNADTLAGARTVAQMPASLAATVSGDTFILPHSSPPNIPIQLTGDQLGDTTTTFVATLQIVSGSAGTAFTTALGRWYNSSDTQIGSDVALTKTATAITLTGTQPSGAAAFKFVVVPPADTVCRMPSYQFGTPARPTSDEWFLALQGQAATGNNPTPIAFIVLDSVWDPITGRVTVPASAGGDFRTSVRGVNDGDVLWCFFDSPLEPTAWLQSITAQFGTSGGGSGSHYKSQVLHIGGNRFAAALYVQSAADGAFYGPRWTWNNTGGATYFENIKLYVGPKPPFIETVSNITLKGIRDEITAARIKPLITLADDSCGISADQFQPSPGLDMAKFFGSGTTFQNMATPGNTLTQSASTVGLLPIHVSVSGGVIPASISPVTISAWDYDPLTLGSSGNPDYDPYAYLCGVLGRLSAGSFTGNRPVTLYFTPVVAPTWPIDVPNGSKLILRSSRKRKGGLTLFPISSVNGTGGGFASATAFVDAVFAANDPSTIAGFVGLTPSSSGYDTGASLLAPFAAKSYYSRLYNPNVMSAATVAEAMTLFGWNWTGTENADWLAGNIGIPGSMRIPADGFHPYTDVAAYVVAKNHFISTPVVSYLEGWA